MYEQGAKGKLELGRLSWITQDRLAPLSSSHPGPNLEVGLSSIRGCALHYGVKHKPGPKSGETEAASDRSCRCCKPSCSLRATHRIYDNLSELKKVFCGLLHMPKFKKTAAVTSTFSIKHKTTCVAMLTRNYAEE